MKKSTYIFIAIAIVAVIVIVLILRKSIVGQISGAITSAKNFMGDLSLPRGIRNNNPGNLTLTNIPWQGKIPNEQNNDVAIVGGVPVLKRRFEQFKEFHWGVRAMIKDLQNDSENGTRTLRSMIYEYAPSSENHTNIYLDFIEREAGLNPDAPVYAQDKDTMKKLVQAIARFENGSQKNWISDGDFNKAWNLI